MRDEARLAAVGPPAGARQRGSRALAAPAVARACSPGAPGASLPAAAAPARPCLVRAWAAPARCRPARSAAPAAAQAPLFQLLPEPRPCGGPEPLAAVRRPLPEPRPSRGLPRRLRVSPLAAVQLRAGPSPLAEELPAVVQPAGAVVLTTGRAQNGWAELRNAHLRTGWAPLSSLVSCLDGGGWHGDGDPDADGEVARSHSAWALRFLLWDAGPPCEVVADPVVGPEFRCIGWEGHRAHLWAPAAPAALGEEPLPLLLVLHGSRPWEWDFLSYSQQFGQLAGRHGIFALVPESCGPTWDFLLVGQRDDVDFLERAVGEVRRRHRVDVGRVAVLGMSDGASLGLSMALANPAVFQAALAQAAGFVHLPAPPAAGRAPRPRVLLEHGAEDQLFGVREVAMPNRDRLEAAGCRVDFRVAQGAGHQPRPGFFDEAVDFWLGPRAPAAH